MKKINEEINSKINFIRNQIKNSVERKSPVSSVLEFGRRRELKVADLT